VTTGEIDADGRGQGAPAAGRFGVEGVAPGTRAGGTCDDRRRKELEEVLTGDEELRALVNGAAAGLPGGGVHGGEECGCGGSCGCKGGNSGARPWLL
jgi:hypothetical protein